MARTSLLDPSQILRRRCQGHIEEVRSALFGSSHYFLAAEFNAHLGSSESISHSRSFANLIVPLPWHHLGKLFDFVGSSRNLVAAVSNSFLWVRQHGSSRSHNCPRNDAHRVLGFSCLAGGPNPSFNRTQPQAARSGAPSYQSFWLRSSSHSGWAG